jgi:putative ABC transport system permease protein
VTGTLYLAWRYLVYHRVKTAILVTSITLIVYLPVGLDVLVSQSAAQLTARAEATPLLVGAKGSPLELVLNSLYLESEAPETLRYAEVERIAESELAQPIPLHVRFHAREHPIVGTSLEYFEFRGLRFAAGRAMALLGECVVGARVAESLGVGPGDSLVSSPESVFDLAGVYPLKMRVVGVLEPAHTPDDLAVFADLKTAWIIEGLGHGHSDLARLEARSAVLARRGDTIVANASVVQYNEITQDNVDSFHFHGDLSD